VLLVLAVLAHRVKVVLVEFPVILAISRAAAVVVQAVLVRLELVVNTVLVLLVVLEQHRQ
jgi:hypothetical protein